MSNSTNLTALDMDHLYLNLQVQNDDYIEPVEANFYKSFGEPIVNNPSLYHVSLVKAEIPATYIPLFNWNTYCKPAQIQANPIEPTSELSISFQYRPVIGSPPVSTHTRFLKYISYIVPSSNLNPNNPIYNVDHFVNIINTTLSLLYTDITTATPALIPLLGGVPIMTYDPVLRIFGIQYPVGYTSNASNPNWCGVEVYLNSLMYNLFDTMPFVKFFNNNIQLKAQMKIDEVFTFSGSNKINRLTATVPSPVPVPPPVPPTTGLSYYSMIQEVTSIPNIYSVSSIIFTSSLPLIPEYLNNTSTIGGLVQLPILSEISPVPGDTDQRIIYIASAEYRLRNLSSNEPISNISIQVYYQDKTGVLSKLAVPPRETLSLKLLLRKKTFQNSYLYELNSLPEKEKREIIKNNFS